MPLDYLIHEVGGFDIYLQGMFIPDKFRGNITDEGRKYYPHRIPQEEQNAVHLVYNPAYVSNVPTRVAEVNLWDVRLVKKREPAFVAVTIGRETPCYNTKGRNVGYVEYFDLSSHHILCRIRGDYVAFYDKGECCLVAQVV